MVQQDADEIIELDTSDAHESDGAIALESLDEALETELNRRRWMCVLPPSLSIITALAERFAGHRLIHSRQD